MMWGSRSPTTASWASDEQKVREILVFAGRFSLPFASALVVRSRATFVVLPLAVIGLVGLNEALVELRWLGVDGSGKGHV